MRRRSRRNPTDVTTTTTSTTVPIDNGDLIVGGVIVAAAIAAVAYIVLETNAPAYLESSVGIPANWMASQFATSGAQQAQNQNAGASESITPGSYVMLLDSSTQTPVIVQVSGSGGIDSSTNLPMGVGTVVYAPGGYENVGDTAYFDIVDVLASSTSFASLQNAQLAAA